MTEKSKSNHQSRSKKINDKSSKQIKEKQRKIRRFQLPTKNTMFSSGLAANVPNAPLKRRRSEVPASSGGAEATNPPFCHFDKDAETLFRFSKLSE